MIVTVKVLFQVNQIYETLICKVNTQAYKLLKVPIYLAGNIE